MSHLIEAVLFDLDGVLADSELLWNDIDAALLKLYGVTYGGEHKEHVIGKSFPLAMEFYCKQYELRTDMQEMLLRRKDIAATFYAERIDPFPDALHVLRELKARGFRLGVASSSVGQLVRPFLERHRMIQLFTAVVTGEAVKRGKPNPDIYLLAADQVGVAPANCLVVEDALAGIEAGKSAGMPVVAIPDPHFVDVSLYEGRADYQIEKLDQLLSLPALQR